MTLSYMSSTSIPYKLSIKHREILVAYQDYKQNFDKIITYSNKTIVPLISDLTKYLGKPKNVEVMNSKVNLEQAFIQLEPEIIILIESLNSLKTKVNGIGEFELKLNTPDKLHAMFVSDLAILKKIDELMRNVSKASNVVFNPDKKTNNNLEDNFDYYAKEFVKLIRKINKEFFIVLNQYNLLIDDLAIEIENTNKAILKAEKELKAIEKPKE